MRHFLIAAFVCLFIPSLYGQTAADSTATDTTKAKPAPEVKINYPFKLSDYNLARFPGVTIGVGASMSTRPLNPAEFLLSARLGYRYEDKGWIQGSFDLPALNRFDYQYEHLSDDERLRTTSDFFIHSFGEIGIGYFLGDSTRKPHTIYMPEENDSLGIDPFVDYKEPRRSILAARAGITGHQNIVNATYIDMPELIDENGVVIGEAGAGSIHTPTADLFHTNTRVGTMYLGFERRRITSFLRDRGDREEHAKRMFKVYGDIMYAAIFQIDPMYVRNTETGRVTRHVVDHTNGGGFERNRLGFRAGGEYVVYFNNHSGLNFQLETGARPGLKNMKPGDALLSGSMFLQGRIIYLFGIGE